MAADPQVVIDKSLRSVFGNETKIIVIVIKIFMFLFYLFLVGNIPYDVTEEKLKDIFSEAGPVVSFKYFNYSTFSVIVYQYSIYLELSMIVRLGNPKVMVFVSTVIKRQPYVL